MSRRNGVLDGTKMSGKERVGNLAILLIVTYTTRGRLIISKGLRKHRIPLKDFWRCIKLMLSFYHCIHLDIRKSDMQNAKKQVVAMLTGFGVRSHICDHEKNENFQASISRALFGVRRRGGTDLKR